MANYNCAIRTNYFHVKDAEKFKNLMQNVDAEDEIQVFMNHDEKGEPVYGFGCYGGISGIPNPDNPDDWDGSYDHFTDALQELVADDDAIIIMEAGHEKLRYITASAQVITSKETARLDIIPLAVTKVAEMLHNPKWKTRAKY